MTPSSPSLADRRRTPSRTIRVGDSGPDVARFQRDLNGFHRRWGAPARALLAVDGEYGGLTALACRRVKRALGVKGPNGAATPRERIVIRHVLAQLRARAAGRDYLLPASARRTPEEIRRARGAADYVERLRARFGRERERRLASAGEAARTRLVRNRSSRNGVRPRLIVLHSTEMDNRPGSADLDALANWFDNPRAQASSHIGNDADGGDIRMVPDDEKAWTQASFNSVSLSVEQMGHASQTSWPDAQLDNTARWIACWSRKYGIPIARSITHGVCQHRDLGPAGGGHTDCGPHYPFDEVLARARRLAAA